MSSCVYTNATKYLDPAQAKKLIKMFDRHEVALQKVAGKNITEAQELQIQQEATKLAVKEFVQVVIADREVLQKIATENSIEIPDVPKKILNQLVLSTSEVEAPTEVTPSNITKAMVWLDNVVTGRLSKDKKEYLPRLKDALRSAYLTNNAKAIVAINKVWGRFIKDVPTVSTYTTLQRGSTYPEEQSNALAESVLTDSLTYNTPLQGDTTAAADRDTLSTHLKPTTKKAKSLLQTTPDLINKLTVNDQSTIDEVGINKLIREINIGLGDADVLPSLTPKQAAVLTDVLPFFVEFSTSLVGSESTAGILDFINKNSIYKNNLEGDSKIVGNPIGYLVQVDPLGNKYVNPNVITAFASVAHNWLGTQGSSTIFNDQDSVKKILGYKQSVTLPIDVYETFAHVGIPQTMLAESLGTQAFKLLGLEAKENIDGHFQAKLELAIGQTIVATLLQNGLLIQEAIPGSVIAKARSKNDTTLNTRAHTNFVKVPSSLKEGEVFKTPVRKVENIVDITKRSGDLFTTLFGTDSLQQGPIFKVPAPRKRKIKNDFIMRAPTELNDAVNQLNTVPFTVKKPVADVFTFLGLDNQRAMNGYVTDTTPYHVTEEISIEGKNRDIDRDIQNIVDFITTTPEGTSFYFQHEVVNNMRVMINSRTVNPESSKIHRHLISSKAWEYKVSSPEDRKVFKLAVAAAFNVKIGDIPLEQSLNEFDAIIERPSVRAALVAISKIRSGKEIKPKYRKHLQDVIMTAITEGKEAVHTLDGLVALTNYDAVKPFITDLAIETDGKTNGVALALQQIPSESDLLIKLQANGMYTVGGVTNLTEAKDKDSYENLTVDWAKELTSQKLPVSDKQFLDLVLDPLLEEKVSDNDADVVTEGGRKLGKSSLMPGAIYGASAERIREIIAEVAVTNFYKELMKASTDSDPVQAATALMERFNQFAGTEIQITNFENIRKERLPRDAEQAFKARIGETAGAAMDTALANQFSEIGSVRSTINTAAKVMFHVFDSHLQTALVKRTKSKKGIPLTKQEIQEVVTDLIEVVPAIRTFYSNKGTEAEYTEAGADVAIDPVYNDKLLLLGTKNIKDYTDKAQSVQVGFALPIRNTDGGTKSVVGNISKPVFTDTGISTFPRAIQSIDSAVAAEIYKGKDVLNLFDAAMYSIGDAIEGTREGNQAIAKISKDYNIVTEVRESLEKLLDSVEDQQAFQNSMFGDYAVETVNPSDLVKELKDIETRIANAKEVNNLENLIVANISIPNGEYIPEPVRSEAVNKYEAEVKTSTEALIEEVLSKPLGTSSENSIDFDNFKAKNVYTLSAKNSSEIFNNLQGVGNVVDTANHQSQLKNVLDSVVNTTLKALDNTELKYDLRIAENGDMTFGGIKGEKVYINVAEKTTPPSNTQNMSAQETYVHELVHAVTTHALDNNTFTRKQISNLFKEIKNKVTIEHFLPEDVNGNPIPVTKTDPEYLAAKVRYEYIFENKDGNSLNEFIAFGLTNEKFIGILSKLPATPNKEFKTGTLLEKTQYMFQALLRWIGGTIRGMGKNVRADQALLILTKQLAENNLNKQRNIFRHLDFINKLNSAALDKLSSKILEPLQNYQRVLRKKKNKTISQRVMRVLLGLPEISKTTVHSDIVRQVLRAAKIVEDTIVVALARELIGVTDRNAKFHELLRISKMTVDQARKQIADSVAKDLLDHYTITPTKKEAIAITKALLKTDLVVLMDTMSITEIVEVLRNKALLQKEIVHIEEQLATQNPRTGEYYKIQAENLGYYMARGIPLTDGLMLNAHNIANMYSAGSTEVIQNIGTTTKLIDKLATLQAIKFTESQYKSSLIDVITREYKENPNGVGEDMNGIANTFSSHTGFKEESLKNLFDNNPVQVIKGYVHETYNPNIDLQIGTLADEKKMNEDGYTIISELPKAKSDTRKEKLVLYKSKVNGARTRVKTIASITNKVARGTSPFQAAIAAGSEAPGVKAILIAHSAKKALTEAVGKQLSGKHKPKDEVFLAPILDDKGEITGFRYLMSEESKDTHLEKQNNFATVLGNARGSVIDKVNSKTINRKLVQLMKDDYEENYAKNPGSFVRIAADVRDPKLRELYNLLPSDMRQDMRNIWGEEEMYIKEEFINLAFGFRKLTITNAPGVKRILDSSAAKKWALKTKVLYTEKLWTDFVGIAKDMIVVKSVVVLKDNFLSNALLLWIKGVPFREIFKNQAKAVVALNDFQALVNKRGRLQRKLAEAPNLTDDNKRVLIAKIANLTSDIDANAVKGLVEQGLFQTIVEDLDVQDTGYSFKSSLEEKLEPYTDKYVPKSVSWLVQQALMTHDTFVYKTLLKATQYSDFIARYTLYEHLVNNKKVSANAALTEVIDTFINYDVPTSPELQWLNDTGFIMFTKFALRIQKVILKTFIKNPVNAITVEAMGLSPTISDSFLTPMSVIDKFQNPIIAVPDTALNMGGIDLITGGTL